MTLLNVRDLDVAFDGFSVIENLSFEVEKGETLAIVGPNGSGKTTLFRALLGVIPFTGRIEWDKNIRIGYVPQRLDIDRQLPMTINDFLLAKAGINNLKQDSIKKICDSVKLPDSLLQKNIGQISSGQLQRAMIAFALLGDPNILLFDEPTASVDIAGEEEIYETLHRLQDQRDLTLILISHDLHLVYRHANKVLCLNKRKICYGEPIKALTPENLEKIYGRHPALFHHIHDNDQ